MLILRRREFERRLTQAINDAVAIRKAQDGEMVPVGDPRTAQVALDALSRLGGSSNAA